MENHMGNQIENKMETGVVLGYNSSLRNLT